MAMRETTITAALSSEEWRQEAQARRTFGRSMDSLVGDAPDVCAYLIALNNHALPDADRRKIRHHWICWLREEVDILTRGGAGAGALIAAEIADALESYLPPEGA
jgi:hypothetical protein